MIRIALLGAGGKMGQRITRNIHAEPDFQVSYVEVSEVGASALREKFGVETTPLKDALSDAHALILAIPDALIGRVSQEVIPMLNPGTIVIGLDPAAAYAEVMPIRDDLTYFVAHPCHPPLFNDETTDEARGDFFGGVYAKHDIVCALHRGPEEHYAIGEQIAMKMYAPVMKSFRITVEQMAILEPALVETFAATVVTAIKEAMDQAIAMGVPADAAWSFLSGHLRTEFGIIFGMAGFPFSDGAKLAIEQAYDKIFKPDWKEQIMNLDALKLSVASITHKEIGS